MKCKLITPEEKEILLKNKYVKNVTEKEIFLTKEFHAILMSELQKKEAGIKKILVNYGFDLNILGNERINNIASNTRTRIRLAQEKTSSDPKLITMNNRIERLAFSIQELEKELRKQRLQTQELFHRAGYFSAMNELLKKRTFLQMRSKPVISIGSSKL